MTTVYSDPHDDEPGIPVRPIPWQAPLLQGVLLIAAGLWGAIDPKHAVEGVTQLIGALLLLQGLLMLWQSRTGQRAGAIFTIAVGAVVLLFPLAVSGTLATVLMVVIGVMVVLSALLRIAVLWRLLDRPGARWAMAGAVLTLALGVLLLIEPLKVGLVVVRVLGACAVLAGVGLVGLALGAMRGGGAR